MANEQPAIEVGDWVRLRVERWRDNVSMVTKPWLKSRERYQKDWRDRVIEIRKSNGVIWRRA